MAAPRSLRRRRHPPLGGKAAVGGPTPLHTPLLIGGLRGPELLGEDNEAYRDIAQVTRHVRPPFRPLFWSALEPLRN